MKEIVHIIQDLSFTEFPAFVGQNEVIVSKLRAAKIYVDEIHCNSEIDLLQKQYPYKNLKLRKVEMTLLDD